MSGDIHIDNKFKSLMTGFTIKTADKDLVRFGNRLRVYNFLNFKFNSFNMYTAITAVGITVGTTVFVIKNMNHSESVVVPQTERILIPNKVVEPSLIIPAKNDLENNHSHKSVVSRDTVSEKALPETRKVIINDTIHNQIQVVIKDTVKVKKKIRKPRE